MVMELKEEARVHGGFRASKKKDILCVIIDISTPDAKNISVMRI
jgi:hypothetical protein